MANPEISNETSITKKPRFDSTGFNEDAVGFHEHISTHPELLDILPPEELQPYLAYMIRIKTLKDIGLQEEISSVTARERIRSAIASLHDSLPPKVREDYDMETVQELRKLGGRKLGGRKLDSSTPKSKPKEKIKPTHRGTPIDYG